MGTNGTILRRNADVSFKEEGDVQKIGVNLTAFLKDTFTIVIYQFFHVCLACTKGFIGTNCDIKCPLPMYGQDCQFTCNCFAEVCDHVAGCNRLSKSIN